MKTLQDIILELQSVLAGLQSVLTDLQALASVPTPAADPVVEVDVKTQSGEETVLTA